MIRFFLLIGVALFGAVCYGEEVIVERNQPITVNMRVSTPTEVNVRTVVFPHKLLDVMIYHEDTEMHVQSNGNTLLLHLRNPDFKGTIPVYDEVGGLYLLNIAHTPEQAVSERLIIKLPPPAPSADPAIFGDSLVTHATAMFDHMLGVKNIPAINSVDATVIRDGKLRIGRRIYQDDMVLIQVIRVHQGPSLRGYTCLLTYRGNEPFRIPYQRLTMPGAVAVYSPITTIVDPKNPGGLVQPGQQVPIFFVAR